jgi:hypothetical protein
LGQCQKEHIALTLYESWVGAQLFLGDTKLIFIKTEVKNKFNSYNPRELEKLLGTH